MMTDTAIETMVVRFGSRTTRRKKMAPKRKRRGR
jgi:hypothetical protein